MPPAVSQIAVDDSQMAALGTLDEGPTTDWDPAWQAYPLNGSAHFNRFVR